MDYLQPDNFFSMVPEIKAQWTADLRGGDIPQARGKLHFYDGSMCCLGVLSKRAADAGAVKAVEISVGNGYYKYDGMIGGLSSQVCGWSGLTDNGRMTGQGVLPFKDREDRQAYLDDLNDSGFSFNQIADLIECFY
jgi:hypothetical protein